MRAARPSKRNANFLRAKKAAELKGNSALAGTVQGGVFPELRTECARRMSEIACDVHPIGGVVPLMENYRYRTLAEVEDKAKNCKLAIESYRQALMVRTSDKLPMDYAMTQNNLGNAYTTLAEMEDKGVTCKLAIEAFWKALNIF